MVATPYPGRGELTDALLVHAVDFDVIHVDSLAHAYSRIRQTAPDLVIVHSTIDDIAACQLRSMLTFDAELSGVPVVTCLASGNEPEPGDDIAASEQPQPPGALSVAMN